MDVAKVIRILGYIVYVALWSPVILLIAVIAPIWVTVMCINADLPVIYGFRVLGQAFKGSIAHDMKFIETGVW